MTRAPGNLLAVRSLLLTHLNVDPDTTRAADLEPAEVGIVGDPAHRGGYHCGSDRVVTNDYSVVESPRDKAGLTDFASALDAGGFEVRSGGRTHNLQTFSVWCVGQCVANAPDTRDIREIIYSPDGRTVKRWDRLGKRSSGDDSHLWHTHFSFFRDATKAGRDQTALFRRYLTTIGLLEDVDMTPEQAKQLTHIETMLSRLDGREPIGQAYLRLAVGQDDTEGATPVGHPSLTSLDGQLKSLRTRLDVIGQTVVSLGERDFTDEPAIVAGVLAGLDPAAIAAAIPDTLAKQVADELARRLTAGDEQQG